MAETYHYRVVYVWGDGQQSATVPFESLDYARKLWTRANASGDLARCYIQRRFVSDWAVTDQTNTGAAGVPATTEITGRSWDAAAAGRRAVEKHADALTRLSGEQAAPACERCGGTVVDPSRHGEGFCVALPRTDAPNTTEET